MMKWTTKFSTVLGCALAAVFLFTSTMEVGAVPLTSSPSGTTTTTTTDTNAAEDGNADAAAEDNAAEDNAAEDNAAGTAAAGTVTSATVTSSSVNIRSEASTSASVAGKATSGQELTVTGETQGSDGKTWYAVTFDNVSGYIRSDLVEAHVSEATAEPAVDETQETEEPEEERTLEEPERRPAAVPPAQPAVAGGESSFWPAFAAEAKRKLPSTGPYLVNPEKTVGTWKNGVLTLWVDSAFTKAMLNKPNITEVLAQAAGQRFGGQARVAFQIGKPSPEDLGTGQAPEAGQRDALDALLEFGEQFDNIIIK